ncbi:hypothetical protein BGW41_007901 [Actinomortierella wolfii]|nr:hypothetical protein BGW41_007901 [Actinomortierella wolfii]
MGQANSKQASSESNGEYPHTQQSSSSPSSVKSSQVPDATPTTGNPVGGSSYMPQLPSMEDVRNVTNRVIASSGEALQHLRENLASVEQPKFGKNSSPSPPTDGGTASAEPSLPSTSPTPTNPTTSSSPPPSVSVPPTTANSVDDAIGNPVGGSLHVPQLPSPEDLRNMTHRILASSGEALRQLRENMPSVETSKVTRGEEGGSPSMAPSPDTPASSSSSVPTTVDAQQDILDDRVTMIISHDQPIPVVDPSIPTATTNVSSSISNSSSNNSNSTPNGNISSNKKEVSIRNAIKVHYRLTARWLRRNASNIAIGVAVVGIVAVAGTMAYRAARAHRQKRRMDRAVRGQGGAKREIVVITSVASLEGVTLALALEQQGFIIFVGVEDHIKADEVNSWGHHDIHPLVLDPSKPHVVEEFVDAISHFLDLQNSKLLGLSPPLATLPTAMSWNSDHTRDYSTGSFIMQEDLSSSTANIHFLHPDSTTIANNNSNSSARTDVIQQEQRATTAEQGAPLFRLAAIIVNPQVSVVAPIEHVNVDQWRHAVDVNVTGSLVIVQKFMHLLRRTSALPKPRRSPRIVLLSSSVTGNLGLPRQSALSVSHHALESLADSLRREIKHQGIDVVCLKPGVIESSKRKELKDIQQQQGKISGSSVGLFSSFNWSTIFAQASTTVALQEAVYDAVTVRRPPAYQAMGSGSSAYSFVAWAVPLTWVDWYIQRNPPKIVHRTVKVATVSPSSSSNTLALREE